jgi:hypothetical protein
MWIQKMINLVILICQVKSCLPFTDKSFYFCVCLGARRVGEGPQDHQGGAGKEQVNKSLLTFVNSSRF